MDLRLDKIPFISLFSGGMGLDLGLEKAGFGPIVANEVDPASIETIKKNRPLLPVITDSVTSINRNCLERAAKNSLAEVPFIAGGPPCQAFSVYGKRGGVEDSRGQLIYEFVRLISELRPLTFLMENVRGLHSMPIRPNAGKGSLLKDVLSQFEAIGYRVDCFLVNVVNYGGPQIRERLICIGNRANLTAAFPQPQFSNRLKDGLPPFRTLGEAIGPGFVDADPSCMNFSKRKLKYLAMVPPGGNWRSLPVDIQKESMGKAWFLKGGRSAYWRRLSFDFPSPTVVTMPNHAGTSMCHPEELRALTVGECAAIQEFPPEWVFMGTTQAKYRQIGNAVPIGLGTVAGQVIRQLLSDIRQQGDKHRGERVSSQIVHIRPHVRTRSYWRKGGFCPEASYYDA